MKLSNNKHRMTIHLTPTAIATAGVTADGFGAGMIVRRHVLLLENAAAQVEEKIQPATWGKIVNMITPAVLEGFDGITLRPSKLLEIESVLPGRKFTQAEKNLIFCLTDIEAETVLCACRYFHLNSKKISLAKDPWYTLAFRRRRAEMGK